MCVASQLWGIMFDVCFCLSDVLSPTIRCVTVAVGVATSRVGQTDTEARYMLCLVYNHGVLSLIFDVVFQVPFPRQ